VFSGKLLGYFGDSNRLSSFLCWFVGQPLKNADQAQTPAIAEVDLASGDVVQLVRTLPCHGRGRGFESRRPRHSFQTT
jgi:hypothetical protein